MAGESDDAIVQELIERVWARAGDSKVRCLSKVENAVSLAYIYDLELSNGGIEQFFRNPCGDDWNETRAALKEIGAREIARLFREALRAFPNGRPAKKHVRRCQQITAAGRKACDAFDRLTKEYFDLAEKVPEEDMYRKLAGFIQACDEAVDRSSFTPSVIGIARVICSERGFDRLPILADALEEAGCSDREILDHCREAGEHVRGCWVVDLLLGKDRT